MLKTVCFLGLCSLGLNLLCQAAIADAQPKPELNYVKGLTLYTESKLELAYPLFETAFDHLEAGDSRKVNAAAILAFAPNSLLHKHKRHFYAAFSFNHGGLSDGNSVQSQTGKQNGRASLARIAGDGYFDEQDFEKAGFYYLSLSQEKDIRNTTYAEYRIGWLELNQQQPGLAVARWTELLRKNRKSLAEQDPELLKSIVRDLGRALAEDATQLKEDFKLDSLSDLVEDFEKDFAEGTALGLKRLTDLVAIENFRKVLTRSKFFGSILTTLLEKGAIFRNFPCEVTHWISLDQDSAQSLLKTTYLNYVNSCAKKIAESNQCETKQAMDAITFIEKLNLTETELLPRISLSVSCKNWESACRDLSDLALQFCRSEKPKKLDHDSLLALSETCTQVQTSRPAISSIYQIYAEKEWLGRLPKDPINQLYAFLIYEPEFRKEMAARLLQTPDHYRKLPLIEQTIGALTSDEIKSDGENFLKAFSPPQTTGVWLHLVDVLVRAYLEQNQYGDAHRILDKYLPMSSAVVNNESQSGLWEYYWLGVSKGELSQDGHAAAFWVRELPLNQVNSLRAKRSFAIAMKFGELELIWNKWMDFHKVLDAAPELKTHFLELSLDLLKREKLPRSVLKPSHTGRILLRVAENDPTLTLAEVGLVLPKDSSLVQDLGLLEKQKKLSKDLRQGRLDLNGLLPKVLSRKFKLLNQAEGLLTSKIWSNPAYLNFAKNLYWKDGNDLLKELERVKGKASRNPELASVTEQMTDLSDKVRHQIQNYAPANVALSKPAEELKK